MQWVEIISIRTGGSGRVFNQQEFIEIVHNENRKWNKTKIKFFRHSSLSADFCVLLTHDSEKPAERGSGLGIRLAWLLEEYGFVNHTVWLEA